MESTLLQQQAELCARVQVRKERSLLTEAVVEAAIPMVAMGQQEHHPIHRRTVEEGLDSITTVAMGIQDKH